MSWLIIHLDVRGWQVELGMHLEVIHLSIINPSLDLDN